MSDLSSKKSDMPMFPSGITKLAVGATIATYLAFVTELQGRLGHLTGMSELLRTGQEVDIYDYVVNLYYGSHTLDNTVVKIEPDTDQTFGGPGGGGITTPTTPPGTPFTSPPIFQIIPKFTDDMNENDRDLELQRASAEANVKFKAETDAYLDNIRRQYWSQSLAQAQEAAASSHLPATAASATARSEKEELKDMVMRMSKTKEFRAKMAASILDEIPKVTKQYKDAKIVVTQGLFMGPAKLIHQDIIRRMEEQEGQQIIREWTTSGDLARLMSALQKIMLLGPSTRVHISLREPMYVTEFISTSIWDGKPKSLATFIRALDSNWEILRARSGGETVISDSWIASHFINQLAQDSELADFVKEWRYDGKPLPTGGYATLKLQLATYLEIHKIEADYGFQAASAGAIKKPQNGGAGDSGNSTPAITATMSAHGGPAGKKKDHLQKKRPAGWIDICPFYLLSCWASVQDMPKMDLFWEP